MSPLEFISIKFPRTNHDYFYLTFTNKISFNSPEDLLISLFKNRFLSKPIRLIRTHGEYGVCVITFLVHWGLTRNLFCLFLFFTKNPLNIPFKTWRLALLLHLSASPHLPSKNPASVWTLPKTMSDLTVTPPSRSRCTLILLPPGRSRIPFHPPSWSQGSLLPTALRDQHHEQSGDFPLSLKMSLSPFPEAIHSISLDLRQTKKEELAFL